MRLQIRHETRYRFSTPVRYGLQQLRKTPKSSHQQQVMTWTTNVVGGVEELTFQDHNRNLVDLIRFERDVEEMVIASNGIVDIEETQGIVGKHDAAAPLWYFRKATSLTRAGRGVKALVRQIEEDGALAQLHALSSLILETVPYKVGASEPDWDAERVLAEGVGVCQDHSHLFIAAAREMGFAARYVSGYLMLNDRVTQEAMHAWAEAHVPDLGWVGFDVSNAISPDTRYVRVATGLDYLEAAPVTGLRSGASEETLSVEITVAQQ